MSSSNSSAAPARRRWFGQATGAGDNHPYLRAVTDGRMQHEAGECGIVVWSGAEPPAELVSEWDTLVTATDGTDVTQLSVWARVKAAAGYHPTYLLARQGGRLVGGALVLVRRMRPVGQIGYVSYGPIVSADPAD